MSTAVISSVRYPRYLDTYCRYLRDDTSIAKVTIYRAFTAVYRSSAKYRETPQMSRVSTIPCSSYHLATCTLQACDAETNSKVAENHNHSTTMRRDAAVNKYNGISSYCMSQYSRAYTRFSKRNYVMFG